MKRRETLAVWMTIAATSLGVLPPFLVGTLSVLMRQDFEIGPRDIGIAVGAFFTTAGIAARILGRVVERTGAARSLATATLIGTVALLVIAGAGEWPVVVAGLVVGGTASAMIHPATAQLLADHVAARGLGMAFGFKQSGAPASTLLAGLAIPVLALSIGWRATFAAAAGFVAVLGYLVSRLARSLGQHHRPELWGEVAGPSDPRLGMLAVGAGVGNAAGNTLAAMLVDSGVRYSGVVESTAGYALAAVSVAAVLARVVLGWRADAGRLDIDRVLIAMPAIGVVGALIMTVPVPAAFLLGAALALPIGWGWSGLLHYRVVSPHRAAAARVTGSLMTGFSLGAAAGPLVLGSVADATSYRVTWLMTGGLFLLAAFAMHCGRHPGPTAGRPRSDRETCRG